MNTRSRRLMARTTGLFMIAVLAAGCGSAEEPVTETAATEAAADAETGAGDNADGDDAAGDGSAPAQTDESASGDDDAQAGQGDEASADDSAGTLPETWPSSIPLAAEYEVTTVTSVDNGAGTNHSVTLTVPQPFEESVAVMESSMSGAGWSKDGATTQDAESWKQSYTSDGANLAVAIQALDDGVTVTYDLSTTDG